MTPAKLRRLVKRHSQASTEHGMRVTVEYMLWRDERRLWKWIMTDHGTYVQVEDKQCDD